MYANKKKIGEYNRGIVGFGGVRQDIQSGTGGSWGWLVCFDQTLIGNVSSYVQTGTYIVRGWANNYVR